MRLLLANPIENANPLICHSKASKRSFSSRLTYEYINKYRYLNVSTPLRQHFAQFYLCISQYAIELDFIFLAFDHLNEENKTLEIKTNWDVDTFTHKALDFYDFFLWNFSSNVHFSEIKATKL